MKMRSHALVLSAGVGGVGLLLVLASAPACSSGFSCSGSSKCSADPPPTSASISACNTLSTGACGSQYTSLGNCAAGQQKCTASNTTDGQATESAISANCSTETANYVACCLSNPSACSTTTDAGGG
jgi:hypothetical protein